QNLSANHRVNLHLLEFRRRQFAGLVQYVIGHGNLSDVVQQGAGLQSFDVEIAQSEVPRQTSRVNLDSIDVIVSDFILGVDGRCQSLDRGEMKPADSLGR